MDCKRDRDLQVRRKAVREREELEFDRRFKAKLLKDQLALDKRDQIELDKKAAIAAEHFRQLKILDEQRKERARIKKRLQKETDAANALTGAVYSLKVENVFERIKGEHVKAGNRLPPKMLRPKESVEEKNRRLQKFQGSSY